MIFRLGAPDGRGLQEELRSVPRPALTGPSIAPPPPMTVTVMVVMPAGTVQSWGPPAAVVDLVFLLAFFP